VKCMACGGHVSERHARALTPHSSMTNSCSSAGNCRSSVVCVTSGAAVTRVVTGVVGECVEVVVDLVPIVTPLVQLHLLSRLVGGVGGMLWRRGVHVLGRRNDRAWSTSSCRRGQSSLCWRRNLDLDGWHPKVPGG